MKLSAAMLSTMECAARAVELMVPAISVPSENAQTSKDICTATGHPVRLVAENVMDLIAEYDVIADGSDNFETRFLVNDACFLAGKTLVSAAVLRFDGQLSTFKAYQGAQHPCYRCVFPEPPPPDLVPSCAEGGVLGAVAGVMGALQATEVIKELLDVGDSLSGQLVIYDALASEFRKVRIKRDVHCRLCGDAPSILNLDQHAA